MHRPLPIPTDQAPEGFAPLPSETAPLLDFVPPPSPWDLSEIEDDDHESILSPLIAPEKEHIVWRKRMNQALKIHVDR